MVDAGLIVLTAFISPFRASASWCAASWVKGSLSKSLLDAPLAICERDPKGLYKKARAGEVRNFTRYPTSLMSAGAAGNSSADAEIGRGAGG